MNYCLDSDTCIYYLRGQYPEIRLRMESLSPDKIKIPAIVYAELTLGALKSKNPKHTLSIIENFLNPFEILAFDARCAWSYSVARSFLEKKGHAIGPNDCLIAAIAVTHGAILVTHNTKEFSRIPDLILQDWTQPE